jgi:hypothetical protein
VSGGLQNPVGGQGNHGEVAVSVSGGQELVVAAAVAEKRDSKSLIATALHGAIVAVGMALASPSMLSDAAASEAAVEAAVRPEPPVSSTRVVVPRVKVNLGQTFRFESNELEFIVIVPVEDLN